MCVISILYLSLLLLNSEKFTITNLTCVLFIRGIQASGLTGPIPPGISLLTSLTDLLVRLLMFDSL